MSDARLAQIAERYSLAAASYDALWSPVIRPKSAMLFRSLPLPRNAVALDVGCGTGILSEDVRAVAPDATVVGIDLAHGMVTRAMTLGRELGITASAQTIPVADASVDLAFSVFVLQHVPDPIAAIGEMGRVVRPGGTGATVTWGPMKDAYAEDVLDELLTAAGAVALERPIDTADLLDSTEKATAAWERAGLRIERAWAQEMEHRWDAEELVDIVTGYGRSKTRFESLGEDARQAFVKSAYERLAAMSVDELTWRPTVVFAIARRR